MPDANSLRALRCPNCGAPIEFAPGQASVRCKFCDSVIENSSEAMTASDHAKVVSGSPTPSTNTPAGSGSARRFVIKMRNGQPVVIDASGDEVGSGVLDSQVKSWQNSFGSGGGVTSMPMVTPTPTRSSNAGCLVTTVIILAIAIAIPAVILGTSPQAAAFVGEVLSGNIQQALGSASTIGSRIIIGSSGTIIPGANDTAPEAIMLTTQYPASGGSGETRLVAVSTADKKLLWQSAPLDSKLYGTPILSTTNFVFVVNQEQLIALKRSDGTVGWQDTLADTISQSLCDCLLLSGTRLAALSDDGTLAVYDTATGKLQWKVSARQDSPRGLYLLGKRVAFMDRDDKNKGVLRAFDLATGKETQAQPACQSADQNYTDYSDWTTPLMLSPSGSEFYILFGSSNVCMQRWDSTSLKMAWSSPMPDGLSSGIVSVQPLFSADMLYMILGPNLVAFSLDHGDARVVLNNKDFTFAPLGLHGSDVILTAKSQRGTTQYAIWAVNGATGDTHWTFDIGQDTPMEPGSIIDDDKPEWLAQPTGDGLRVVRFQSASDNKSYKLLLDMVNWDTGESAGQRNFPLNLDTIILSAPDWVIWKDNTMWMILNYQLKAFDFNQNKFTYSWP
jgi:WD40 repeat protein